ncbi:MAG: hypothetical protein R3C19_19060 [Planctomycetaceae bacterium]
MDSDNVSLPVLNIDKNLGDGWNLDDNPVTNDGFIAAVSTDAEYAAATQNGLYPAEDNAFDRGVVFGVEGQQLAFSEVLGIRSPEISAGDHQATPYDDQLGLRDFLFVELQEHAADASGRSRRHRQRQRQPCGGSHVTIALILADPRSHCLRR